MNVQFTDKKGFFNLSYPRGFNLLTGYITHPDPDEKKAQQKQREIFKINQTRTITTHIKPNY